ncbi:MAG: hypothetical protein HY897_18820 [Deltaproteobacteria bacterium]|nr:hypothetical protein [Deltaproteobacteria bacterium]
MARKNGCELKIDLMCSGLRVPALVTPAVSTGMRRTRAGLGSGLELIVRGRSRDTHVNAPVTERFARSSPYRLEEREDGLVIFDDRDGARFTVEVPPPPAWYGSTTSRGTTMSRLGVMQGTYLAVYVGKVCSFWTMEPPKRCAFCTTGLNVGNAEEAEKAVEDIVETATAAKRENGVTFVHFNSGFHSDSGVELVAPYVRAIKRGVGALVGVQLAPDPDLSKYDRLIDMGVEHFSFCYEFHDPDFFRKYLPGKDAHATQKRFFDAMEHTARRLGKGRVSGEIIAGIEPLEDTLRAIDYITSAGAFPTICIFRPLSGSDLEGRQPPSYADMRAVFAYAAEALRKNGVPVGLAPNLEVSIVPTPADILDLGPDTPEFRLFVLKNRLMKRAAWPYFRWRMRRHDPGAF